MGASEKTKNYNLPIYKDTDSLNVLNDFNNAMIDIDKNIKLVALSAENADSKTNNNTANIEIVSETATRALDNTVSIRADLDNISEQTEINNVEINTVKNNTNSIRSDLNNILEQTEINTNEINTIKNSVQSGFVDGTDFISCSLATISYARLYWKMETFENYRILSLTLLVNLEMNTNNNELTFNIPYLNNLIKINESISLASSIIESSGYMTKLTNANISTRNGTFNIISNENLTNGSTYAISLSGNITNLN